MSKLDNAVEAIQSDIHDLVDDRDRGKLSVLLDNAQALYDDRIEALDERIAELECMIESY
jgi:hypothetical protein